MNPSSPLNPRPPFVWPEPRVIENLCSYQNDPPFGELALKAKSLFGIVSAISFKGIQAVTKWINENPDLKISLIIVVYPACITKQGDLIRLLDLVEANPNRLSIHICPLETLADRSVNALCVLPKDSHAVHIITGPTEDIGFEPRQNEQRQANFVFRADPALVEAFRRYFDWLWVKSRAITDNEITTLPHLVIPEGTVEAAQLWKAYMDNCLNAERFEESDLVAIVNSDTGDVTIKTKDDKEVKPQTEELGLAKMDQLAESIARLYEKGLLVSVDKMSRIPPLDSPLDPSWFGDASELQTGNVKRKVTMRVSIIDEKALKDIEKRRQGLRTILTKFTFGLADNIRWMPLTACKLFESELKRINDEGTKLISDLLQGDVDKFIEARRANLLRDIKEMYKSLGKSGQVTDDIMTKIKDNLKTRLTKAKSANFMPTLSYSTISFAVTENEMVSPWGQAYSLLSDIANFPREALTDGFFFRGLKVKEDDLIRVMDVADDVLIGDLDSRGIKNRCLVELQLLDRIEKSSTAPRDRCELVWGILKGDSPEEITKTLLKKEQLENQSTANDGEQLSLFPSEGNLNNTK